MSVNEIKDFFFENYDKTVVFSKESSYFSLKSFRKKIFTVVRNKLIQKNT